jgi:hypothetical protein
MTSARERRSSAAALAVAWAALIAYASLFPFSNWRWPPGSAPTDLLVLRWVGHIESFDVVANLLGYVPLGATIWLALHRAQRSRTTTWLWAVGLSTAASYVLEVTQQLLPPRVPSLLDWLLNSAGATLGALAGDLMVRVGVLQRLVIARDRWLERRDAAAALLLMWPVALLFPAPVPLGLGQVGRRLRDAVAAALADINGLDDFVTWLQAIDTRSAPLSTNAEMLAVALGLLGPCLVAYAASRANWRRLVLTAIALAVAVGMTTLSTALNFGPDHALAWRTQASVPGLALGAVLALVLAPTSERLAAGLGLIVITAAVALLAQAPTDPYYAQSLHDWEQGRFIRFHGAAQWVGWLWPYAAILWLLVRVSSRD